MDRKDVMITVLGLALVATLITAFVLVRVVRVPAYGKVKSIGVEIYAYPNGTALVQEVDWGLVDPGGISQTVFYVKNPGTYAENLTIATENWVPTNASQFITLTWNLTEPYLLGAGQIVCAQLTLSVKASILGIMSFSFDIIVRGEG